jgi:hypothetical protein
VTLVGLPLAMYLTVHGPVILHLVHLWSALLLGGGPLMYLAAAPNALWWLPGPAWAVKSLQRLAAVVAAGMLIAGAAPLGRRRGLGAAGRWVGGGAC